ncbi:MAG: hypothetical protein QNJ97_19235 [Myxococcota bacterium]|nr:hypothetical protein [Myxococcota bacterium]
MGKQATGKRFFHSITQLLVCAGAIAVLLSGCRRTYGRQACRMESETVIATTRSVPSAVTIDAMDDQTFVAAWSADQATWIVDLSATGAVASAPWKIQRHRQVIGDLATSEPAPKTFWPANARTSFDAEDLSAVTLDGHRLLLLILERPGKSNRGGAYAVALDGPLRRVVSMLRIGPAGEYANRITARKIGNEVVVAWHEGALDASRILIVRLDVAPLKVLARGSIKGEGAVSHPSLAARDQTLLVGWTETSHMGTGLKSLVKVGPLSRDLRTTSITTAYSGRFLDTAPVLTPVDDRFGLVFRDDADGDDTPEFYVALVEKSGSVSMSAQRISQADGWKGPGVVYREPHFISAAIRSFQRNLLIGLNRFDRSGVKLGGEFQVYADKTDFVRVDLAVNERGVLLVYAEDRHGEGRILSGSVVCTDTP